MFDLSSYFKKFSHIKDPRKDKEIIVEIINNELLSDIKPEEVIVSNKRITLQCSPIIRSEVFMRKEIILDKIRNSTPHLHIEDIS